MHPLPCTMTRMTKASLNSLLTVYETASITVTDTLLLTVTEPIAVKPTFVSAIEQILKLTVVKMELTKFIGRSYN